MKVLFFSPVAFFSVHALPEALVAESLEYAGCDIVVVNCNGLFRKHCLAMTLVSMSDVAKKEKICAACKYNRDGIAEEFKFPSVMIDQYVTEQERATAHALTQNLRPESYLDFEIDGIPVSKFALYEFWLNHKLSSPDIPLELWDEYLALFENGLLAYFSMQKILKEQKPDRLAMYNSFYSLNRIVCALADKLSIPHFSLHAGGHHLRRLQQMTIFRGIGTGWLINRLPELSTYRTTPCTSEQIALINEHIRELLNATSPWVYSIKSSRYASSDLLNRFGIKENQKVLLAVMRSNDERMAATYAGIGYFEGTPLFENQLDWLAWLAEFARNHPEYVVIFRVHPREFPNKREQVMAKSASALLTYLETLERPANLHINLPSDNFSLHDLFKITDVLLNNSSTAGLEGSLFGIPVVGTGDVLYSFDQNLQEEAKSITEYVEKIEHAASAGWSFDRVITAYRWLNYVNAETSIDISDGYTPVIVSKHRALRVLSRSGKNLLTMLGAKKSFPEVQKRSKPLRNMAKLNYAILNNKDSHVGFFPQTETGNVRTEYEQIESAYRDIMSSISAAQDHIFKQRIQECVRNSKTG